MTSKLNIDISLAVTLNIIRPLFVDKTIVASSLSSSRRTSLLQQQPLEIFSYRLQTQSSSSEPAKRQKRRSTTFRRLISKIDQFQNETSSFNEHPEQFVRTLLTKLLDSIRSRSRRAASGLEQNDTIPLSSLHIELIPESSHTHMGIEQVQQLLALDEYDDVLNALPLLTYLDLNRLLTNDERICFFANLYNLLIIVSHVELIRTALPQITATNLFRNDLERLVLMLTNRVDVGQLTQLSLYDIRHYLLRQEILVDGLRFNLDPNGPFLHYAPTMTQDQQIKIGLVLTDCIQSSTPCIILTPELINEQLRCATRDFIEKCVTVRIGEAENALQIQLPHLLRIQFADAESDMVRFVGDYTANNDVLSAITGKSADHTGAVRPWHASRKHPSIHCILENQPITTEVIPARRDFAISFDYRCCSAQLQKRHRRRSSLPSVATITNLSSYTDFLPQTTTLPNHLIDPRTISFVQEKSPALGQILQIYVQSVVNNQSIEADQTPLKTYFASLLLSPALIESTSSIGDEWFRSIVLNDLTYQHDLLLYLCSCLWDKGCYQDIVDLFDSLLPSFIVHSPYCQILRDLALLSLIKQAPQPNEAYQYLRRIHDCHLLIRAVLTYLPRFDGPNCLKLLELCLTSCKKSHQDYIPWIQERLNTMYVYKTLCLGALAQFNKCMEKASKDDNRLNMSIEELAIKKTSAKCLTWQSAQENSQRDPLAVVTMFIYEKQFDMGHKWLTLLYGQVDDSIVHRVRYKLVEEHIHWLLKEENGGNGSKILEIIDTIQISKDKWQIATELMSDLSQQKLVTYTKSIPFSRLVIKFRLLQYMLENFADDATFFQGEYDRSKLCVLVTGLTLFFNCIPIEQTDSYVQLVGEPLLIVEQLLMNSVIDIAKLTIETLKVLIEKYALEKILDPKQIDQLIETYTKKSVQLNVAQSVDEATAAVDNRTAAQSASASRSDQRRTSLILPTLTNQRKNSQDLTRRNNSGGANQLLNSIRQRMSPKASLTSPSGSDFDQNVTSPLAIVTSPTTNTSSISSSIPIKPNASQAQSSSFFDYLSTSFSSRTSSHDNQTAAGPQQQGATKPSAGEFSVPIVVPPRKAWISDDEVNLCMCCNASQFSMFNRRHHCRRCGRVVCKSCSQQMTVIKDRLERTCKECYQHMQSNPSTTTNARPETNTSTRKLENLRPLQRTAHAFKRQSIRQLYLSDHRQYNDAASKLVLGTSLVSEKPSVLHEESLLLSSSFTGTSPILKATKLNSRAPIESPQKDDLNAFPLPIVNDQVQYQLTGTSNDEAIRNDFHYDQSPSISLCLSLIELHSDQYQCGKILIKLCEYLSEQLSTKQRNVEIDYGLVLNIIKNLLFTAKMKLMTMIIEDERMQEQQQLIDSCDLYNNLVDILNRLNMANCSLPALNELLQQDTLRRIRNQLLDDERYQLAMDISTRCNLDTQTIWFQWGMAYLSIGQYADARDKFEKCLQKTTETSETVSKQQQRNGGSQEKILNDIVAHLESSLPLKYSMKAQYLTEQQTRLAGQSRTSLKYLNSLSTMPRPAEQGNQIIQNEIVFYLNTYGDDAHLLGYYIRHQLYTQAFEHKCSLAVFRDHIYLPLLKRNHMKYLFNYILSHPHHSLTHHLKFVGTYMKEQDMYHSLQQLQVFTNDFLNAGYTFIKLFTFKRTTYIDLFEKRMHYLQKASEYFQQAKIDSEQSMAKVQSTRNKIDLQQEVTRYVYAQLKRLGNNGSTSLPTCPTLFDGKEAIVKLIFGLITVAEPMASAFALINKIIHEMKLAPAEVFVPCAEEIGKRRDYRSLQQLLQILRENGYSDNRLHDEIIETCVRQTGSDFEQVNDRAFSVRRLSSSSCLEPRAGHVDSNDQE